MTAVRHRTMISAGWLNLAWLGISSAVVGYGVPNTRIPQNIDKNLLNVIKNNLRRNNDDYNDQMINDDSTAPPSPATTLATATPAVPLTTAADLVLLVSASINYPDPAATDAPAASVAPRAAKRVLEDFDRNDILGLNEKNTNTEESEEDNNRGLIQVFIKSKPVQPTPRQLMSMFAPSAAAAVTTRPSLAPTYSTSTIHVTKTLVRSRPVQRKRFASTKTKKPVPGEATRGRESPRADILDMAPAKGSRINAKRAKGRLCQRHVLLPEGPKYDSGGAVYLQPHDSHRPFPQTRAPRLLLPACCNCCKKSVLGCE